MRSSSLSTLVCLAVAVMASPTPLDPSSLQARDAWTPPVRRDVFLKRSPVSEPQPEPEIVIDKRSPFTLTRNSIPAVESIDSITTTPSGNGVNARLPFFFKRDGKLQARDVVALEARKAELEQREVEEFARREAEDLVRRDAEDLARREAEDLARREAEEREAREASVLRKRAALEDIEARELELETAKREYEEMYSREYDEIAHFSKREPQFNIASLISQLSGNSTAGAGGSTNSNSAASRLSALTNGRLGNNAGVSALTSALSRFGFNFRREEESVDDRDFDDAVAYLSKRDPQFNIASLISQLSGNTTAGAGGSTNTNSAASRLSALTNGRLGNLGTTGGASGLTNALSRLGFNFRREEESAAAREPFDFDSFLNVRRQELSN